MMKINYPTYLVNVLLVFLLCLPLLLTAQQNGNRQGKRGDGNGPRQKATLKGKVIDELSGEVLEYATITLFSQRDSSMVTGGITDEKGNFLIESRPGRFFAKIEFLAYQTKTIEQIKLGRENLHVDLSLIHI